MLADNDGTDISNSSQMSAKFPGHSSSRRILSLEELFLPEYGSAGPDGPGYSQEDGSLAWLIKESKTTGPFELKFGMEINIASANDISQTLWA